jgi:hypothetical protein
VNKLINVCLGEKSLGFLRSLVQGVRSFSLEDKFKTEYLFPCVGVNRGSGKTSSVEINRGCINHVTPAQDRNHYEDVVNKVMKFRMLYRGRKFLAN